MKNSILTFAIALNLLLLSFNSTLAQNAVVWKGGTPGRETSWDCDKNWSNYKVPDAFSDVVIPDVSTTSFSPPSIKAGAYEVNSIQLQSNAQLTIEKGAQLIVYGSVYGFEKGSGLLLKGTVLIHENVVAGTSKNGFAQAVTTTQH